MDPTSPSHAVDVGVVSTVKLGADGKERALLVRRGAARWVCLLATVLVLCGGGAWLAYESRAEHKVEMGRLTRLLRSTGERVQELRRVSDRLDDLDLSAYLPADSKEGKGHIKEKLERELKLGKLVHSAQEEHERAQAAMMKQGMPSDEHAAAADQAARQVPVEMQRAMLAEFRLKGQFLVWSTTEEREAAWRKSPPLWQAAERRARQRARRDRGRVGRRRARHEHPRHLAARQRVRGQIPAAVERAERDCGVSRGHHGGEHRPSHPGGPGLCATSQSVPHAHPALGP